MYLDFGRTRGLALQNPIPDVSPQTQTTNSPQKKLSTINSFHHFPKSKHLNRFVTFMCEFNPKYARMGTFFISHTRICYLYPHREMFMRSALLQKVVLFLVLFGFVPLGAQEDTLKAVSPFETVALAWNEAHNNWHYTDLKQWYADKVFFYGKFKSPAECVSEKTRNVSPTKAFFQKITSPVVTGNIGKGLIRCDFTIERMNC